MYAFFNFLTFLLYLFPLFISVSSICTDEDPVWSKPLRYD